jgi:hypothetical protein
MGRPTGIHFNLNFAKMKPETKKRTAFAKSQLSESLARDDGKRAPPPPNSGFVIAIGVPRGVGQRGRLAIGRRLLFANGILLRPSRQSVDAVPGMVVGGGALAQNIGRVPAVTMFGLKLATQRVRYWMQSIWIEVGATKNFFPILC